MRAVLPHAQHPTVLRVHFDRGCKDTKDSDHFHRLCSRCGYEWIETCSETPQYKTAT